MKKIFLWLRVAFAWTAPLSFLARAVRPLGVADPRDLIGVENRQRIDQEAAGVPADEARIRRRDLGRHPGQHHHEEKELQARVPARRSSTWPLAGRTIARGKNEIRVDRCREARVPVMRLAVGRG